MGAFRKAAFRHRPRWYAAPAQQSARVIQQSTRGIRFTGASSALPFGAALAGPRAVSRGAGFETWAGTNVWLFTFDARSTPVRFPGNEAIQRSPSGATANAGNAALAGIEARRKQ